MAKITPNWFSTYDSPTYHLTLYLTSSKVWNTPETYLRNDTTALQSGNAVVIAQSGVTSGYSIENVMMLSKVTPGISSGNTTTGTFQFDLYEPLGFKLLDRILKFGAIYNFTTMASARYVLKVELIGRDPTTGKSEKYNGVFFYPMIMNQIQAQMSADGTRYNVVASNIMKTALLEATVAIDVHLDKMNTPQSFVQQLNAKLTKYERDIRTSNGVTPPVKKHWTIEFDPSVDEYGLRNMPFAGKGDSSTSGAQASNVEDPTYVDTIITANTNVVSYVTEILTRNTPAFQEKAEKAKEANEPVPYIVVTPTVSYGDEIDPATNVPEQVIKLTIEVRKTLTNIDRDPEVQKERLNSASIQQTRFKKLPIGKRYDYLYTGLNTEVINFDLNFEQLFFVARDPMGGYVYNEAAQTFVPTHPTKITNGSKTPASDTQVNAKQFSKYSNFLSDVDTEFSTVLEMPQYEFEPMNPEKQQVIETKSSIATVEAVRDREAAVRQVDFMNVELTIKGDPYWLGTPGAVHNSSVPTANDTLDQDSLIAFITFNPDESTTDPKTRSKGELNLAASGVYKIIEVETKFQQGRFEQRLVGYRDRNTSTYYTQDLLLNLGIGNS